MSALTCVAKVVVAQQTSSFPLTRMNQYNLGALLSQNDLCFKYRFEQTFNII